MKIISQKGFTLIELLVVIAIVGVLSAVIFGALSTSGTKGNDANIKANFKNAAAQAEVFYYTNTASRNSYAGVCDPSGVIGGAKTLASFMSAASKTAGLGGGYISNSVGAVGSVTCNENGGNWAAEAPIKGAGANQMWCIDSTGKSKQVNNNTISASSACP